MTPVPASHRIYHITHVRNLTRILDADGLVSHARMIADGGPDVDIGMSKIKQQRLALPVVCHPGDSVGEYVPFYFCPRSVMLYVISCRNHPELAYGDGQDSIPHLEADLHATIGWAAQSNSRWAFSLSNAGAAYAEFRSAEHELAELDWPSIQARDWKAVGIKERKQAEFLVHGGFPWSLVTRIGVHSSAVAIQVTQMLSASGHKPVVAVRKDWYY